MSPHWQGNDPEEIIELALLREQIRLQKLQLLESQAIRKDLDTIVKELSPKQLKSIKTYLISGVTTMPVGPLTITVGQAYTATVVGFDQNGAPFSGPIPAPAFAVDNAAIATIDASSGAGAGVSAGVANVSASLTSAEGLALSDTETLTVVAAAPVLTSIKVSLQ